MPDRITLLVPRLAVNLENPTPKEIHAHLDPKTHPIVRALGGIGIEAELPLDEDLDGLYAVIFDLPSRQAPWAVMRLVEGEGYVPRERGPINGAPKLRTIESHTLAIALSDPSAGNTWRNRAARAYLEALPPAIPIVIWVS